MVSDKTEYQTGIFGVLREVCVVGTEVNLTTKTLRKKISKTRTLKA